MKVTIGVNLHFFFHCSPCLLEALLKKCKYMFALWFNFNLVLILFSVVLGMVMHDNNFETKENLNHGLC